MTDPSPIAIRGPDAANDPASDERIVEEVLGGALPRFEVLMRRYNARLFRTARSILRDDAEAEDTVQQTYLAAYEHLAQFDGRARFATWLSRIAVNEALRRRERQGRLRDLTPVPDLLGQEPADPEAQADRSELRGLLEAVIDQLPESYRVVFVLRDVQELSTRETAESLDISEQAVRVRLHRARQAVRDAIDAGANAALAELYGFAGERCDRIVRGVSARLRPQPPSG